MDPIKELILAIGDWAMVGFALAIYATMILLAAAIFGSIILSVFRSWVKY